jgi:hypothetical protein
MKYSVGVSLGGAMKYITVECETGDEAATLALHEYPGAKISNIEPYLEPAEPEMPPAIAAAIKAKVKAAE